MTTIFFFLTGMRITRFPPSSFQVQR